MAILQRGFDQTNLRGSVGGVTYRRVGGVTIASQKVPLHVKAKQTRRLMAVRMRWPNLVALWQSLNRVGWHPSFIKTSKRVSDFNRFMAVNMSDRGSAIYLPRDVKAYGGGVVADYVVTEGTLSPSVSVEFASNQVPVSDLSVGTLAIGAATTLKAFSESIIANNPDWQVGDKLTIVIVQQSGSTSMPTLRSRVLTVTLATDNDELLLSDILDVALLGVGDGSLALSGPVIGGVAFVHSRIVDGETVCSRQSLVLNNSVALAQYSGTDAFIKAVNSYGGFAAEEILTPNIEGDLSPNV